MKQTKLGHCKLKIENCKLQIAESCANAASSKRRIPNLQFSFFIFQFAISSSSSSFFGFTLQVLMVLALVASASAQKKSSCIECHIKLDDTRLSAPAKLFDSD